ncbi:MAG: glutamate--cysteine ligase [Planctomycetes bacterium]|nr:glutamate--cysteine ligase [Planctomycetota bacterium]
MSDRRPLHLFEGYGIELEYMIVDRDTLDVAPIADRLLEAASGDLSGDFDDGPIAWSNELVLHVIELKTNGPAPDLLPLPGRFNTSLANAQRRLDLMNARLLPSAMHPWMDPARQTKLWPHETSEVYSAYDRIFDCKGHGWSNLQSCHVNLPFGDAEEFGRLHAALRVILPLLPALAASSPFVDGRTTGWLDNRLEVYRKNQARIPSVTGQIVPEAVFTPQSYRTEILERIWRDAAPLDPEGLLRDEFFNSRGVIARFVRDAFEIRVLDVQETPAADIAIAWITVATLKAMLDGRWLDEAHLRVFSTERLARLFLQCARDADEAVIEDHEWLAAFGVRASRIRAGDVWRQIAEQVVDETAENLEVRLALKTILERGPLARRLLRVTGLDPTQGTLRAVYGELAQCLEHGVQYAP